MLTSSSRLMDPMRGAEIPAICNNLPCSQLGILHSLDPAIAKPTPSMFGGSCYDRRRYSQSARARQEGLTAPSALCPFQAPLWAGR